MNKENAADYLPLVQALADGRVVECRLFPRDPWKECTNPDFTIDPECYRIKPEPREIWVNTHEAYRTTVHHSEDDAKREAFKDTVITRYREVLE